MEKKEYNKEWKHKNKAHVLQYQNEWRKKNRERFCELNMNSLKKRLIEIPWLRHHRSAKGNRRGIKYEMTLNEIRDIWWRDKAFDMKKPTIDRIDERGHYTRSNVRFLELKDNISRSNNSRKREPNGRLLPGRDYYPESRKELLK